MGGCDAPVKGSIPPPLLLTRRINLLSIRTSCFSAVKCLERSEETVVTISQVLSGQSLEFTDGSRTFMLCLRFISFDGPMESCMLPDVCFFVSDNHIYALCRTTHQYKALQLVNDSLSFFPRPCVIHEKQLWVNDDLFWNHMQSEESVTSSRLEHQPAQYDHISWQFIVLMCCSIEEAYLTILFFWPHSCSQDATRPAGTEHYGVWYLVLVLCFCSLGELTTLFAIDVKASLSVTDGLYRLYPVSHPVWTKTWLQPHPTLHEITGIHYRWMDEM